MADRQCAVALSFSNGLLLRRSAESIKDHTVSYGDYGLGLGQTWGLRNGLNPVTYVNSESPLASHWRKLKDDVLADAGTRTNPGEVQSIDDTSRVCEVDGV